jgi:hypothetical protein
LYPRRLFTTLTAAVLTAAMLTPSAMSAQRRLVVNADEWTLDNCCIAGTRNGDVFAINVRNWLTGGVAGNLLGFSNTEPGISDGALGAVLNTNGYTWTQVTPGTVAAANAWANRSSYSAIFLGGQVVPNMTELIDYVTAGGSVYLMGGTGFTLPGGEDTYWDPFLARFGLDFGTSYNGIGGDINTSAFATQGPFGAALFTNVNVLFQNNGNNVLNAAVLPADVTRQLFVANQSSLFGAAVINMSNVPEPSTYLLLGSGILAIGFVARRRARG